MKGLKRFLNIIITLNLALILSACARSERQELRVGVNLWPGHEALYLVDSLGLYEKEGVKVRLIDSQSLGDARRAFERGQVSDIYTSAIINEVGANG